MEDDERLYLVLLFVILFVRILKSISDAAKSVPTVKSVRALVRSNGAKKNKNRDEFVADARSILEDLTTEKDDDDKDGEDNEREETTANEGRSSERSTKISLGSIEMANFALHAKALEQEPKAKRLLVTFIFVSFGAILAVCWWFLASPQRDRMFALRNNNDLITQSQKRDVPGDFLSERNRSSGDYGEDGVSALDAIAKSIIDEKREGDMEVVVRVHFVQKRGPTETNVARAIRERFQKWVILERGRKAEEIVKVTFRGCVDIIDRHAFEASTRAENGAESEASTMFEVCDKGRSELARRARFYARSTRSRGDEDDERAKNMMYSHVENEMKMNYATYPNEIYAYIFDDDSEVSFDGEDTSFQLHIGTERNAFVDAKWTSSEWSGGGVAVTRIRGLVQKLYSSAWKVARKDAKFDGHFGASAMSLSFALVIPDDDEGKGTFPWNFRKDVREPFVRNLSKRLEQFLKIEAESRVVYHSRTEENNARDVQNATIKGQLAIEMFTRALPLRKMDVDLTPSMPSGRFVVYRKKDTDDGLLPKNWFAKRDNVGITIWEGGESITDILPFLFANVRARLLGLDITSDENYAKYALPDAANIFSMMEVDALSSTRVRADMLETVQILRGAMNVGDIDAKDASYLASRSYESLSMLRDAVALDPNQRRNVFELVSKARKLAFQTSRASINVREDGTFPPEHELALAMPLMLPLLVAFTVRFAREFCRYLARLRCRRAAYSDEQHHDKVD